MQAAQGVITCAVSTPRKRQLIHQTSGGRGKSLEKCRCAQISELDLRCDVVAENRNIRPPEIDMHAPADVNTALQNTPIDVKIKLAGLWTATMFCYLYGDYFELYVPGKLSSMLDGKILPLGAVTQEILLGTSLMLAVQAVMVFLSLVMTPTLNRWVNVVSGLLFAAIVLVVITQGGWKFYRLLGAVEIALLLGIVWQAWRWPRTSRLVRPVQPAILA